MNITEEQWRAKGRELFGDDQSNWIFVCPSCEGELSIVKARAVFAEHLPTLRARGFRIEQECIGRYVPGAGCDWCAYGLLSGPVYVDKMPIFDFAGKPFTGGAVAAEASS